MHTRKLFVIGIVLIMTFSAMSLVGGDNRDTNPSSGDDPKPTAGSTPRTVLFEEYTATWCPACNVVAPAVSRIADEYQENELAMIVWHPSSSEIGSPVSSPRANYYGWAWLPSVVMDGGGTYPDSTLWVDYSGSASSEYDDYRLKIDYELTQYTNLKINLWGSIEGSNANVLTRIEATDPVTQTDLYVYTVLYEDDLYSTNGGVSNKFPYWRHVVRDFTSEPLSISEGDILYFDHSFTLQPSWQPERLGVVVFVQTDVVSGTWDNSGYIQYNREVLQAAELDFIHDPVLLVNDVPLPTWWDIIDAKYQKILSYNDIAFDTWDELSPSPSENGDWNVRDPPSFDDLKDYSVVFWFTMSSGNTLNANEMTAITSYLDAGGNLLITGSEIGDDLSTNDPTNLTNYLHATFVNDHSGDSQIIGIASDPISDPWNSTSLSISSTSPDVINPADIQTNTTFNYTPSSQSAALRSQHDFDSRVVFFGFSFCDQELTTGPPNFMRTQVINSVIDWLMPVPPTSNPPAPANITDITMSTDFLNVTVSWNASPDDGAGEDDIIWYNIYLAIHYDGPYVYYISMRATGAPTYSWKHTYANLEPSAFYYKIYAKDSSEQSTPSSETAVKFMTPTIQGTNLLSIPLNPVDTSLTSALQTINYDMVWAYDPTNPTDPWKSYIEAKPYKGDLTELNNTMGFWVNGTTTGNLITVGMAPSCTNIPLYAGWNLVSYPSFTPQRVADAFMSNVYDRIETFDPTAPPQYLRQIWDPDFMMPGYGYWIKVPSDQIWTVCN